MKDVRAAVLQTEGYLENAHLFQDRSLTRGLAKRTPYREVGGWWVHEFPGTTRPFTAPPGERDRESIVAAWFDYWVKGLGPKSGLGIDHQDETGTWHKSRRWPPPEARRESLYLSDGTLRQTPGTTRSTFLSVPSPETSFVNWALELGAGGGESLCTPGVSAVFTAPVIKSVVIAGNPMVDLELSSDQDGGLVSADVFDLPPEFDCAQGVLKARHIGLDGADLQHHLSRYEARPFAVNTPTHVRLAPLDVTTAIKAGHRIAVVLSHGEPLSRMAVPGEHPQITIHPDSRVVLPLISGSLRNP